MTSKERVRAAVRHKEPDRLPANFECTDYVKKQLQKEYRLETFEQVLQKFEIDIREVRPEYIGPELKSWNVGDVVVKENYWGFRHSLHWNGREYNGVVSYNPLGDMNAIQELESYNWPNPDWFDYESIKRQCDRYKDKAIIVGHEGPFQMAADLRSMDKLFVDMALNPKFAEKIYSKMNEFEMEYYERILQAADGQIDIIRPHDDYGTQISLIFSVDMWNQFMKDNTKKLTGLTHKYGAYYQQHSCGAVRDIIPNLIECNVDILEPIQKVKGMEPKELKKHYGKDLAFHGGIDTQYILPRGTVDGVKKETRDVIDCFNINGGYILMASQSFESDVPLENIEAMYSVRD